MHIFTWFITFEIITGFFHAPIFSHSIIHSYSFIYSLTLRISMTLSWRLLETVPCITRLLSSRESWGATSTGKSPSSMVSLDQHNNPLAEARSTWIVTGMLIFLLLVVCRKHFLRQRAAALVIQKHWRGHKGRKLFRVVSYCAVEKMRAKSSTLTT